MSGPFGLEADLSRFSRSSESNLVAGIELTTSKALSTWVESNQAGQISRLI